MKMISHADIINANISAYRCYEWVNEALLQKDTACLPAKISLKPADGVFYNTMPVLLPATKKAGLKLVTRYPDRCPSLDSQILLYDLETGDNLALLDGNWITAMRTGAVAAHSIKLFAKESFHLLGYIGLGNTARASLCVLLSLYPDRAFTIKLKKYKNQHILFAQRFADYPNVSFVYCDSYEEVIQDSDVVVSAATFFGEDICTFDCFAEGVTVIPIHTRGFTQCDYLFDKIYADDTDHVCNFRNFHKYTRFAEVSSVLNGKAVGRENDKERIMVYNIGIALQDIYFASKIYDLIGAQCADFSLEPPTEKFWI